MEAVQTTETSVDSHQSTRRYNPKDIHLHTDRRENLKSHFLDDFPHLRLKVVVVASKINI
jgi:hypothetical protein